MKLSTIGVFTAAALLAAAGGFWFNTSRLAVEEKPLAPAAGQVSSEWTTLTQAPLKDLDGKPVDWAFTKGKVTVVNFWATWCAPCKEEIPDLIKLQQAGAHKNVQIVGIGVDTVTNMRPFASNMKINYPLVDASVGGIDLTKNLGNKIGALPFTLIFNADGSVMMRRLGKISYDDLKLATGL
jgi:thiol-disulfide isomerase/thioredoxin